MGNLLNMANYASDFMKQNPFKMPSLFVHALSGLTGGGLDIC